MTRNRPDFAADLSGIERDVTSEVGKILEIAGSVQARKPQTESPLPEQTPPADSPPRPRQSLKTTREPSILEREGALVNITTRITATTNELLSEAALHQRLKKTKPDTRQDIIEAAVKNWLQEQGYR